MMTVALLLARSATFAVAAVCAATPCTAAAGKLDDCSAQVDAAALKAMGQNGPLGQMQIWGDPIAFEPNLRRVAVDVFGDGEYDVDVTIGRNCLVQSMTTRRATNGPP